MKKIYLLFCGISFFTFGMAQDCPLFPADCPDGGSIENGQSESVRLGNGLLIQEIHMQNQMRNLTTAMMLAAGKKLHWEVQELDEVTNLNPFQQSETPYELRSPRYFGIAFECILNQDSLKAWKNWLTNLSLQLENQGLETQKQQQELENSPKYLQYQDSANYYMKAATDFLTAHPNFSTNTKEVTQYTGLMAKVTGFTEKMNAVLYPPTTGNNEDPNAVRDKGTLYYRNLVTLDIFFEFNAGVGLIYTSDGEEKVQQYTPDTLPGIAKSVTLSDPDLNTIMWHFDQWPDMQVILLGGWKQDKENRSNYTAAFEAAGQGDEHTPKKVKSDQVQTIAIHIMGNPQNARLLIKELKWPQLTGVLVK